MRIVLTHIRPNVLGPVVVIATINLALAILTEATLSFLGIGVPPTMPSLGSMVRIGNEFLFSGDWWISIVPGAVLVLLSLAVNLLGDWLRDALNPRLERLKIPRLINDRTGPDRCPAKSRSSRSGGRSAHRPARSRSTSRSDSVISGSMRAWASAISSMSLSSSTRVSLPCCRIVSPSTITKSTSWRQAAHTS